MDFSRLTVPQLKKELKERGLPLGGVKVELVARLTAYHQQSPSHSLPQQSQQSLPQQPQQPQQSLQSLPHSPSSSSSPQQQLHQQLGDIHDQLQQVPQQLQQIQQLQMYATTFQLPSPNINNLTTNTYAPSPSTPTNTRSHITIPAIPTIPTIPYKTASTKVMELDVGFVDPRDKFGSCICMAAYGEEDVLVHEGVDWSFYCTKSMDYQVWATVYFKCMKKRSKKRGLENLIPTVEATIEFPTGKRVQGVLTPSNTHRLVVIKDANQATLSKTYGADSKEKISNVKVSLRTVTDAEAKRTNQQQAAKKAKVTQEKEKEKAEDCADWGVYGQMDSDDENRSEYESSDYSSSDSD